MRSAYRKFAFLLCALMMLTSLNAQDFSSKLKGRILEKNSGKPVPGANIYIAGTVWGTTSDVNGRYEISSLPPGNHELIVSIIGFSAVTKPLILQSNKTLKMDVQLEEKIYEYGEVQVAAERPEDWKNSLAEFKKLFLGSSEFADECIIENDFMIDFNKTADGLLIAATREPLRIKNNALGFDIICIVKQFVYNKNSMRCKYQVLPVFKEMDTTNEPAPGYWETNRKIAYDGSLNHFLMTLKVDSLFTRGYKVQKSENPFWKEFRVGSPIYSNDSLLTPGIFPNEDVLYFKDYLRISYKNKINDRSKVSFLRLPYGRVTIDEFGYPHDDMGIEVLGDWTLRGIADLLPKYYFFQNQRE